MRRRQSSGHSMPEYCRQAEAKFSKYTLHPVCTKIPWMDKPEFLGLVDDIKQNGLLDPIIRHDGKIVDGKHRLAACLIAGVKPRFVEWDGQGSLPSWIVSKNLFRRHLTASQRAAFAVNLLPELRKDAKERQREGGRVAKKALPFVTPGKRASTPRSSPARTLATLRRSWRFRNRHPNSLDEIRAGNLNVSEAKKVAALPSNARKKVLAIAMVRLAQRKFPS